MTDVQRDPGGFCCRRAPNFAHSQPPPRDAVALRLFPDDEERRHAVAPRTAFYRVGVPVATADVVERLLASDEPSIPLLQVSAIGDWFTRMGIAVVTIQLEPAS